jgi:two-component system sensor histidine kinase DevS
MSDGRANLMSGDTEPLGAEAAPRAGFLDPLQTGALLQAVINVGSDLDLEATLQRIVETAASLVGARYGALGVVDGMGTGLQRFITVGLDGPTQQAIGAEPRGLGLLGVLISDVRPLRMHDLAHHPSSVGFPNGHPPMTSFLGVPVLVRDKIFGSLYLTDKIGASTFTALDEQLATGLAVAAGVAIDHARLFGEAEQHRLALAAVHEVATAFVTGTDPRETLLIIAGHARQLVGADLATVALPADGDTMVIEVADGPEAGAITGRQFARRDSIFGDVMRSGRTVVVDDASLDQRPAQPQVSAGRLGPGAFVALRVDGRTFGTLAVARNRGGAVFTRVELALIETFAAYAGVIVERDQDRRRNARLSVVEDQERIARNLHDTVIQRLFAAGLSLQAASSRTEEIAKLRMIEVVDELDAVINTIRTVIFDIDARELTGIRQQVLDLARELVAVLGFEPTVLFTGPVDTVVGANLGSELVATLREALSNVARHARARRVEVAVRAESGQLTLLVSDDGVGMSGPPAPGHAGLGVTNMTTRAAQLGGVFRLDHPRAGGTVMSWRVPCH